MSEVREFENYLECLVLNPALYQIKTVEADLRLELNPTHFLNTIFFERNQRLDFEEFYVAYLDQFMSRLQEFCGEQNRAEFLGGLKARLYRTMVGFLTEYHAYFLCREFFPRVIRSTKLDMKGVDFQIMEDDLIYNIHIYVDTPRANQFRKLKEEKKGSYSLEGRHINFPYSLRDGKIHSLRFLKNHFGVYSRPYAEYLRQEILNGNLRTKTVREISDRGFVYE